MRRFLFLAVAFITLSFALMPYAFAGRRPPPPDAAGVLRGLGVASFIDSGQDSIQAVASDSAGNVYVAGTTSASDFPVKNASQTRFGESRILRTTDLGATWTRVGSPPVDVSVVVPDPADTQVLFAGGPAAVYKSSDAGQTWRVVYRLGNAFGSTGALVIDPSNHLRLAAIAPETGAVIRSVDAGETWNTVAPCPCGAGQLLAD